MRKRIALAFAVLMMFLCLSGCGGEKKEQEYFTSPDQLNDSRYSIGVGMGTADIHAVEESLPKAEVIEYSSVENGYLAVQAGMLDAFAYSRDSMQYAMASGSLKGVKLLEENVGEGTDVVVGISPKTDVPNLKQKVNDFVAAIHADGTFDEMYTRWVVNASEELPELPKPEHPNGKIIVGTSGTAVPFSYYKGTELIGMDLEMIARFANFLNAEVEIVVLDYTGLSAAAEAGTLDCVFANLHATPERAEVMDFSNPIYKLQTGLMVRSGDAVSAKTAPLSLADFDGKKIGVLTGSVHDTYVKRYFPNAEPQYFSNVSDQAVALVSGALDAFSIDVLTARALISENDKVTYLEEPLGYIDTAYAFAKGQDGETLCGQMNDFLAKLTTDGTMAELEEKWLSTGAGDYETDLSGLTGHDRTLTFATSCSGKPNAYYFNNAPTGFEVEIAAMFCREYGYDLDIEVADFSSIIPGIAAGKYDFGADGIMVTEERAQSVNFSVPDYHCSIVIVYRKDAAAPAAAVQPRYTSISEMQGSDVKIGLEVGANFEPLTISLFPNADYGYFNTISDMTYCVSIGELDGFLCDEPVAHLIVRETPGVTFIPEILQHDSYAAVFPKTEAGRILCEEFSDFVRTLKSDGTMQRIIDAWINDDRAAQRTDYASLPNINGLIRMAASGSCQPYGYIRDGELVGLDIDMMIRFCEAGGYALEVDNLDFSALIPSLGTTCDVGANGISITEERKEQVYFSEPYYDGGVVVIIKSDSAAQPSFFDRLASSFEKTFIREQRWKLIVQGIGTTVFISAFSALFGTLLGFGICMLRRMKNRLVYALTTAYIRVLQGTPQVVLLMVLFYLVFSGTGLSGEWVAIIAFSLNFAAYVSEMMRTGIEAVDIGQTEAALALGFTKSRAFFKFILPQAAQNFLPVYKGEFISLVKMTSVVGYIAVQDLTKMSDIIRSRTYEAFFPLIATALIYFAISGLLTLLLHYVEIKVEPDRTNRSVKGVTMQ